MYAHRIKATIDQTGQLHLNSLPFQQGEQVEVIILSKPHQITKNPPVFQPFNAIAMRGKGISAAEMVIEGRT
ncbi:MAG: hypothetical protein AAGJ35_08580 [Myxococcota bacterium]